MQINRRGLDPVLFDRLTALVRSNQRDVHQIEDLELLGDAEFANNRLTFVGDAAERAEQRADWFRNVLSDVRTSSLVFADPDNGLCEDTKYEPSGPLFWKRMPLSEAHVLAAGRTGIFYHHNSRYPGGHVKEIQHWLSLFGKDAIALYWRPVSNRTFFIVHPTDEIERRILGFVDRWSPHFEMYSYAADKPVQHEIPTKKSVKQANLSSSGKACPECGHQFSGKGWGGIDAHWKSQHEGIMSYEEAWPLIKAGRRPSEVSR